MNETAGILLSLFLMFTAAKTLGEVFERIQQPAVVGEILAGILLGILGLVGHTTVYETLAEIGAIVLLFYVGLENRFSEILRVGWTAFLVAALGVILPFLLGYGWMVLLGQESRVGLFIGTAMVATSVGITGRVLADMGVLTAVESRVILGAAVIDDILGMVLLGVVGGLGGGTISWSDLTILLVEVLLFLAFVSLLMTRAIRRYGSLLERLRIRNAPFVVAITLLLGLSSLSAYIGLAAIVGAFLAGMAFAETRDQFPLEHQVEPLYDFLVPFFFVIMGSLVEVESFLEWSTLALALGVTLLAVLGKLLGCGLGAYRLRGCSALIVGMGMVPRGEVGIIVALLGLNLGIIDRTLYGVVLFMVLATTLLSPPLLKGLFKGRRLLTQQG